MRTEGALCSKVCLSFSPKFVRSVQQHGHIHALLCLLSPAVQTWSGGCKCRYCRCWCTWTRRRWPSCSTSSRLLRRRGRRKRHSAAEPLLSRTKPAARRRSQLQVRCLECRQWRCTVLQQCPNQSFSPPVCNPSLLPAWAPDPRASLPLFYLPPPRLPAGPLLYIQRCEVQPFTLTLHYRPHHVDLAALTR